ncbi:MAG: hypothetical protein HDS60_02250 [Barnesiella sp.]|nr:hypothetical protein [Barnesiella sp.]
MTSRTAFLLSAFMMTIGSFSARAQNYFDDDIYYNPAKDTKTVKQSKKAAAQTSTSQSVTVVEFPAADTYSVPASGLSMSVDEYNRRGIFAQEKAAATDTSATDFNYTRRIERFYNPDVVIATGDDELANVYYAEPANVNIIVNNTSPSYWGWSGSYYSPWSWSYCGPSWAYNPWGPSWGPSWGWGWNYPSWSWGWGPSWNPGWGPAWGVTRPNRHPGHAWTPGRVPATRPSTGTVRPGTIYRPGSVANVGNGGRVPSSSTRPGAISRPGTRPSTGIGTYGTTGTGRRPSTTATQNPSSYTRPTNPSSTTNSNNSYQRQGRSSSRSSSYSSGGGFNSGSSRSSGGFSSGGSSRGGRAGGGRR